MGGRLFVVATAIGDPDDLGTRARTVLSSVGAIAAEDTRVARTLLDGFGITPPRLVSCHDHNEEQRTPQLIELLREGTDVALISDAGTPLLSDPGYRLVRAAIDAGVQVVPIPGPSAALAALTIAGLPTDRFTFLGFLPRQSGKRSALIAEVAHRPETLVFYEAPHRILETLDALIDGLGDRAACLAVSLTKVWERTHRGTLPEVRAAIAAEGEILGEMTLVVAGFPGDAADVDRERVRGLVARLAAAGVSPAIIRDVVAETFGWSRRDAYQAALAARGPTE